MCYYNGQKVSRAEYIRLLEIEKAIINYDFLKNDLQTGFDYGKVAVLKPIPEKLDFDITQMEWGFIPPYLHTREDVTAMRNGYTDNKGRFHPPLTMLNARGEELLHSGKVFRQAALSRRCIVLSSGFYDWRHVYGTNKRTGKPLKTATKYPYYVTVKGKGYFYMLGIWQPWTDRATGEYVESVAIVTTAPPKGHLMAQVHNSKERMPTIPTEEFAYEWIFGDLDEQRIREIANFVLPSNLMEAYPIAKDFRDQLDPTLGVEYKELPPLNLVDF